MAETLDIGSKKQYINAYHLIAMQTKCITSNVKQLNVFLRCEVCLNKDLTYTITCENFLPPT